MNGDAERFDDALARANTASRGKSIRHRPHPRPAVGRSCRPTAPIPPFVEDELRKLHDIVHRLEEKQDAYAKRLAQLQREGATEYSATLFRQSLSAAVVNAAPSVLAKDTFGAAAQFVPVIENLKGGAASFATRPIATLAVPAIALGIYALRQPRTPVIVTNKLTTKSRDLRVTVISPDGGDIHYELGPREVTRSSPRYGTHLDIPQKYAGKLRVRAFLLLRASETAEVEFTYAKPPAWILRFGSLFE